MRADLVPLDELWPDPDRRDDALERLLLQVVQPERSELAPSELRVLEALSHGLGYQGAAEVLDLHVYTVMSYSKRARQKLAAKDTTHAVAIALRSGLIT